MKRKNYGKAAAFLLSLLIVWESFPSQNCFNNLKFQSVTVNAEAADAVSVQYNITHPDEFFYFSDSNGVSAKIEPKSKVNTYNFGNDVTIELCNNSELSTFAISGAEAGDPSYVPEYYLSAYNYTFTIKSKNHYIRYVRIDGYGRANDVLGKTSLETVNYGKECTINWIAAISDKNVPGSPYSITVEYTDIKPDEYSISYYTNDGTNSEKNPSSYGSRLGVKSFEAPVREGYNFEGWYDNKDLTGDPITKIDAGTKENISLYAKWDPCRYQIKFDANGGTGSMTNQTLLCYTDVSESLNPNEFVRLYYIPDGWNTKANGTGTHFDDCQDVKQLAGNNQTITLYAQWKLNPIDNNFEEAKLIGDNHHPELAKKYNGYYAIENSAQLLWFAAEVNNINANFNDKNAVLTADIVLNYGDVANCNGTKAENWTEWIPIGTDDSKYQGIFDGQNHTISGLYVNNTAASSIGLFGSIGIVNKISNASILNVGVINSYFKGDTHVGGICGDNYNGSINNCYNSGTVASKRKILGGVCGNNLGTIKNCYNTGSVNGSNNVGGVSGKSLAGIENCYNTGKVSGIDYIGGICGSIENGGIKNCYNTGEVSGNTYIGGICGNIKNYDIINCYNTGKVSGKDTIGGICGYTNKNITKCWNTAEIKSKRGDTGGICGILTGSGIIQNCYNTGNIFGNNTNTGEKMENFGGICGNIMYDDSDKDGKAIQFCYNTGNIRGKTNIGGICGIETEKAGDLSQLTDSREPAMTCFYLENCCSKVYDENITQPIVRTDGEAVSAEKLKSGKVTFDLNRMLEDNDVAWRQDMSLDDSYPVLDSDKIVYENSSFTGCCADHKGVDTKVYRNTKSDYIYAPHEDLNSDGKCDNGCGKYLHSVVFQVSSTLEGNIGLNYYIGLPEFVTGDAGAYALITVKNSTEKVMIKDLTYAEDQIYKFTSWLSAKEMGEDVSIRLFDGNDIPIDLFDTSGNMLENSEFVFSLKKYFEKLSDTDTIKNLADTAGNYGLYAQKYFKYNDDEISTDDSVLSGVTIEKLAEHKMNIVGTMPEGLSAYVSLLLKSETSFRMYFKAENIGNYSFMLGNESVTPKIDEEKNLYYIEVSNIAAKELDKKYTISVGENCTITFDALSYAYKAAEANKDQDLVNVCKALYLYNEAAKNYFSGTGN